MSDNTGLSVPDPQEQRVTYRLSDVAEYDLRGMNFPQVEYVGGICLYPVGGTVFLYGPPGIGKSLVQQMIQHTIAWGKPIGTGETQFVPEHLGNVLYLDFEGSDQLAAQRSKAITPELGERPECDIFWHTPSREADGESWAPTLVERLAQIEEMLERHEAEGTPISLLVIDTFTNLVGGNDSKVNAYDFDVAAIRPLNAMASRYDICVVLIHHPNKSGEMSGSTGRSGSAWIVASLKATVRDEVGRPTEVELRMEKNRLDRERSFTFSREYTETWTFETDVPVMACGFKGNTRKIWDLLSANGPGTKAQIIAATGYSDASVKAALNRLKTKGLATVSDDNVWSAVGRTRTQLELKPVHQKQAPAGRRTQLPATVLQLDVSLMDPEDPKKNAIKASMALMWEAVKDDNRRQHPAMFTEMPKAVTGVWEGRNKYRAWEAVEPGTQLVALDKNAAYLGATNTRLPRGPLEYDDDPNAAYAAKRSGFFLVDVDRDQVPLVGPFATRTEDGTVWVPTPIVKELSKFGPVQIHESWTSAGTEALLTKWRETLRDLRAHAMETGDDALKAFVKSCYSMTISTMGTSASNHEMRRPEWGPIIRSQAYANLRNDARKVKAAGFEVLGVGGTDEIVIRWGQDEAREWADLTAKGAPPLSLGTHLGGYKVKRTWIAGEDEQ